MQLAASYASPGGFVAIQAHLPIKERVSVIERTSCVVIRQPVRMVGVCYEIRIREYVETSLAFTESEKLFHFNLWHLLKIIRNVDYFSIKTKNSRAHLTLVRGYHFVHRENNVAFPDN